MSSKVECYRFSIGGTYLCYNNGNSAVTFGGYTYNPVPLTRNKFGQSAASGKNELEIKMGRQRVSELVTYSMNLEGGEISLILYQYDFATELYEIVYKGFMTAVTLNDLYLAMKFESVMSLSRDNYLDVVYVPACVLNLYSTLCQLPADDYKITGTIKEITGRIVTVYVSTKGASIPATVEANWFRYGVLKILGDARLIIGHAEFTTGELDEAVFLLINTLSPKIAVGDSYSAYVGCNKSVSQCKDKFSNLDNYLGFPYSPYQDSVYVGERTTSKMTGGKKN